MPTTGALTDYAEQKLLEALLKNTSFAGGATLYLALYLDGAPPTESGGGTEVTGGSYVRQPVAAVDGWSAGGQVGGAFQVTNAPDVVYPVATADWGTVGYVAVFDTITGGHMLVFAQLDGPRIIESGAQFKLLAGNLSVGLS